MGYLPSPTRSTRNEREYLTAGYLTCTQDKKEGGGRESDAGMWQVQNENDGTGTMYKEANTADECTAIDLHIPGLARS